MQFLNTVRAGQSTLKKDFFSYHGNLDVHFRSTICSTVLSCIKTTIGEVY